MTDFRQDLYSCYHSGFKGGGNVGSSRERTWCYYRSNLLPLLDGIENDARIIDLGCGSGELVAFLLNSGYTKVAGIDVSGEQVAIGKAAGLPVKEGDVDQFLENTIHSHKLIFAIDLVEHLTRDELMRFGRLILKRLDPGGLFILRTPNGKSPFSKRNVYGDLTHMTIFSDESLEQWLKAVGFLQVDCIDPQPAVMNFRDRIRILMRKLVLQIFKGTNFFVTGRREAYLGENIIAVARK